MREKERENKYAGFMREAMRPPLSGREEVRVRALPVRSVPTAFITPSKCKKAQQLTERDDNLIQEATLPTPCW